MSHYALTFRLVVIVLTFHVLLPDAHGLPANRWRMSWMMGHTSISAGTVPTLGYRSYTRLVTGWWSRLYLTVPFRLPASPPPGQPVSCGAWTVVCGSFSVQQIRFFVLSVNICMIGRMVSFCGLREFSKDIYIIYIYIFEYIFGVSGTCVKGNESIFIQSLEKY